LIIYTCKPILALNVQLPKIDRLASINSMGEIEGVGPILWSLAKNPRKPHTDPRESFAPKNFNAFRDCSSENECTSERIARNAADLMCLIQSPMVSLTQNTHVLLSRPAIAKPRTATIVNVYEGASAIQAPRRSGTNR
jgi:hypothetical protein